MRINEEPDTGESYDRDKWRKVNAKEDFIDPWVLGLEDEYLEVYLTSLQGVLGSPFRVSKLN